MPNRAREKAGAPPLQLDESLTAAARAHADVMASRSNCRISLQASPPSLVAWPRPVRCILIVPERMWRSSDRGTGARTPDAVAAAPRKPAGSSYNIAGFGVVRSGGVLFVVQDFGHSLPSYSMDQTQDTIASAVLRTRRAARLPELVRRPDAELQAAVCSMAKEDRLRTRAMHDCRNGIPWSAIRICILKSAGCRDPVRDGPSSQERGGGLVLCSHSNLSDRGLLGRAAFLLNTAFRKITGLIPGVPKLFLRLPANTESGVRLAHG